MRVAYSVAVTVLLTAGLSACDRETTTAVAPTPATPPPSAQSSTSAPATPAGSAASAVVSTSPDYTKIMERMRTAADRLRGAVQAMAQEPAGPRRNDAIKEAHQALQDTNQAMIQLPPNMRVESKSVGTTSSAGASGSVGSVVYPKSDVEYTKAMEKLQQSAQKLREAIQAAAQEQPGERRNSAVSEAQEALYNTNQAMIQLPPGMRTEK